MTRTALGEIEHLVLVAVLRLGGDGYGVAIIDEVATQTGREMSQARAYLVLQRLERKGLVESRLGDSEPVRGGRAKRYFRVTTAGEERLRDSAAALFSIWKGLDPDLPGRG